MLAGEGRAKLDHHLVLVETLDRGDLGAFAGDGIGDAGAGRRTIEQHGAGAADAVLATEMRARQIELLAHEIRKAGARLGKSLHCAAVHVQFDHAHAAASRIARLRTVTWTWRRVASAMPALARRPSATRQSKRRL